MADKVKRYISDPIDVTYSVKRCIHAAECVRGLPAVFDTNMRPWIQPANGAADAVAEVVQRCPTGALHFERKDGGSAESAPDVNQLTIAANGPYYVRGDIHIGADDDGQTDTRMALCRCGQSANKPFCDNTHRKIDFEAAGTADGSPKPATDDAPAGPLHVTPSNNGPLLLRGNFELVTADGRVFFRGTRAALCRCGGSGSKPFCDNTHKRIGFQTEDDA